MWGINDDWQRTCSSFLKNINKYPKSKQIQFIKRTNWILPCIVRRAPISGAVTFYTGANKSEMSVSKAGTNSKVVQSPHDSDQNSELYAILMVLLDFKEPLNIITDSQYAKRVVLLIETVNLFLMIQNYLYYLCNYNR